MFDDWVRPVLFVEHSVADSSLIEPHPFDVFIFNDSMVPSFWKSGEFLHKQYCICLLYKVFYLKSYEIKAFLQYQCTTIKDPLQWLNQLEKLLELNRNEIVSSGKSLQLEKIIRLIEIITERLETNLFINQNYPEIFNHLSKLKSMPVQTELFPIQKFIDTQEFIQMMKISKRTAQSWRDQGIIPFSQVGNKIYYRLSDIENLIRENYKKIVR